jgi:hypothetical protein
MPFLNYGDIAPREIAPGFSARFLDYGIQRAMNTDEVLT